MNQSSNLRSLQYVIGIVSGKHNFKQVSVVANTVQLEAGFAHEAPLDICYINRPSKSTVTFILPIHSDLAASLLPAFRAACVRS